MLGLTPRAKIHNVFSLTARVKLIGRLAREDMLDPYRGPRLRALAGQIVKQCPLRGDVGEMRAGLCELQAVFNWVVDHVRYSGDIGPIKGESMDLYQSPYRTIEMGVADCDDHASLVMTLLRFLGWDVKLRVSSSDGKSWSHIYPMAKVPKVPVMGTPQQWVPVDVTLGHNRLGVEARHQKHQDFTV